MIEANSWNLDFVLLNLISIIEFWVELQAS